MTPLESQYVVQDEEPRHYSAVSVMIAYALLGLMALVVISATIELAYTIILDVLTPPGFFFGIEALFELFGLFLMVLIGLELMSSIRLFLVVTPAMEAGVSTSLWSMGDLMEEAPSSR